MPGKDFHTTIRAYAYSSLVGIGFFVIWIFVPHPAVLEPFQMVAASAAPLEQPTTSTTIIATTSKISVQKPKPSSTKTPTAPKPVSKPVTTTATPEPLIPPPPAVVVTQPPQSSQPIPTPSSPPVTAPAQAAQTPTEPSKPVAQNPVPSKTLFSDSFAEYKDGLITSEYAYWNADDASAKKSSNWELTSGSLFEKSGVAWTGVPDSGDTPNSDSSNVNGSGIFRLTTKRANFGDVKVSFDLNLHKLSKGDATPEVAWDGVHVFLRYQSQYHLYYASINRRDDTVVIKKKVEGGPSNGGTYYDLSTYNKYKVPYDTWQNVSATIKNESDGSVAIELFADGKSVAKAKDTGTGGPPITTPGKVGIRADNADIQFKNFTVTAL